MSWELSWEYRGNCRGNFYHSSVWPVVTTQAPRRMSDARILANSNYLNKHADRRQVTERIKYYKRIAKKVLQAREADGREPELPGRPAEARHR